MKHDDFKVGTYVIIDTSCEVVYGRICKVEGIRGADFGYVTIGYEPHRPARNRGGFRLMPEKTGGVSPGWFSNSLIISEEVMALKILEAVS